MADGRAAQDPDRLPWLSETRGQRRSLDSTSLLFWAFLAIVLVAGVSYWLGLKSVGQPDQIEDTIERAPPTITETLAEPINEPVPPGSQSDERLQAPGLPDVSPVAEPAPVPIPGVDRARPAKPEAKPKATPRIAAEPKPPAGAATARAQTASPPKKRVTPAGRPRLQAWPADQSAGAHGRVVRVGTFYTRRQAKQGWARIVRVYPGMRRLRAVVVPNPSLRNGRMYYRLQFGTTSQAHSEVLCQRMRIVAQSCVTVGLPGRPARAAG